MNLSIKATKTTLTPAMRNAIEDKFSILERFLKPEDKLHFECEVDKRHKSGLVSRVEVTIHPHGFFAEVSAGDFYEALDLLIPKIKEQLVKKKDKLVTARKRGSKTVK